MRRLGQNFLTSKNIARRIAAAADIQPADTVLEIGPGKGILTEAILEKNPKKIIAIEKDKNLASFLQEKYSEHKNLEIINGDILKILNNPSYCLLLAVPSYKIVANIPYYITSRLLRLIFSHKKLPEKIVLMVQREVAERICARPPHMNLLALSIQAYGCPRIAFRVPKTFFKPRPKVDSAVIVIDNISRGFFKNTTTPGVVVSEEQLFEFLHVGFRHKRKMLLKNLKNSTIKPRRFHSWAEAVNACGINEKARAENLSLDDWKCLIKSRARQ
ncbi:MAG: 16S rRNA (adenine(1518)-N(6)/adenine(1519)-N(6))-dimethyltransferase RsmA [Patescibacteria group bacterium]